MCLKVACKLSALLICVYCVRAGAVDLAGFEIGRELTMMDRAEMTRDEKGFCTEISCRGPKLLGDYPVTVVVQANAAGRIQLIVVSIQVAQRDVLLKAAIEKFGRPAKTASGEVQNLFGAKFSQASAAWQVKGANVVFFERCETLSESCIGVISNKYVSPNAGKKLKL